jgi:cell wall-associated NlpC family hydrolase
MAGNQAAVSGAQQAASAQQQSASNSGDPSAAHSSATSSSTEVRTVVQRAMKQIGMPYSWGGGGLNGPSLGNHQGAHIFGFDCSGLVQYAYAPYVGLPRDTYGQIGVGYTVLRRSDIQAGDLIFSNFGEGGKPGPGHVQLAISSTKVVEAPHTGDHVKESSIPTGHIVVKRIL